MTSMRLTLAVMILTVGLVLPSHAQTTQATVTFQVVVQGAPCPNATYWALIGVPQSVGFFRQLADPDRDGVFTGSIQEGVGNQRFISLVQGIGTQETFFGPAPGEPSTTIRDVGLVTITEDMVFEGTVAGCPAGLPDTGVSDWLPGAPLAGGLLLLASGAYLRRRPAAEPAAASL